MDKFLIRTPREAVPKQVISRARREHRQATIESLEGVVVIEDIYRIKAKLTIKNQTEEVLVTCLRELGKKMPCKTVMLSTKIGRVVNKLQKHSDVAVSQAASDVYRKWRKHFETERDRPQIEVSFDTKSEKMRLSARRFLSDALGLEVSHKLPEVIEREMLHQCGRNLGPRYRRCMRKLVFSLRHQEDLRKQTHSGALSAENLVKQFAK